MIKRIKEAREEYQDAVRAYDMVPRSSPEFAEAQKHKAVVLKYLDILSSENASVKDADHLKSDHLGGLANGIIQWLSPLWEPPFAGQLATAADIPKQEKTFESEYGNIKITCQWDRQVGREPAYLFLKWEADMETDHEICMRLVNPDTQKTLYDIPLGSIRCGEEAFTAEELGFDPSAEKWAMLLLLLSPGR